MPEQQTNQQRLNSLLTKYHIMISRKESQYFLVDEFEIRKLRDLLELKEKDVVAVIGSNGGLLEETFADYNTIVFEKNERIIELMQKEFSRANLKIINTELNPDEKFNKCIAIKQFDKRILFSLLLHDFELAILIANEGFAEKLIAEPGFLDYSETSVLANHRCNVEIIGRIEPNSYFPKQKNGFRIIKLTLKKKKTNEDEAFADFVKNLFRFKNKNVENALESTGKIMGCKMKRADINKIIEKLKLEEEKVMLLSPEEIEKVFREIFKQK